MAGLEEIEFSSIYHTMSVSETSIKTSKWQITYRLRLHLPDSRNCNPTGLYIAYPRSIAPRQKLCSLKCSHPACESTDEWGNHWLRLTDLSKNSGSDFLFTYQALIELFPTLYSWMAFPGSWPEPDKRFIEPEVGIESNDSSVQKLAAQISQRQPLAVIRRAFSLVRRKLQYKLKKKEYGASYAARHGEGDCTEYSSLFAAILRAHKIGARINMGYWGEELHALTEVYAGGLWVPVEITNFNTPFLGISLDFITMLRANWMSKGSISQVTSFYYRSASTCTPKISTSAEVKNVDTHPGVKLLDFAPELPYGISAGVRIPVSVYHENASGNYCITVENHSEWEMHLRLLLAARFKVLKVTPIKIAARSVAKQIYQKKELGNHFRSYPKLNILLVDEAERSLLVGEIDRKNLISVLD